ncbi:IS1182 family transposase [Paenibacillus sp. FSL R7-0312]|uniref:IS1182 family transposase n=1 Tax=Paenibacillus sp. FSL R7-0312 TaxID=2921682 RepID=UPI000B0D4F2B|nr:IS1182 family transposase [Paenibacillus sp. FSL R5-0912]
MYIQYTMDQLCRTLNRFRSQRMKDVLETVFTAVLQFLADEKYISFEHYFVDGIKIEANAIRYTFVWGKAVSKHKAKLQEKVHALFANIEAAEKQEEQKHRGQDLSELGESAEIDSEKLEQMTHALESQLLEKPKDKPMKKAVQRLRKDLLPRLLKYEQYQNLLGDRNSFSKTDPDATFMRMKEDHMRNAQLKLGYNVQIGTENQFILAYSLHQRPTDTRCLQPHMEKVWQILGRLPQAVIADAGYGSEENYAYLENEHVKAVVKYGSYHKEKSKAWKENDGKIEKWTYDETKDTWTCPAGQTLHFRNESKETLKNEYKIRKRHYRSQSCENCPLKERCTKSEGNREVVVSLERLRHQSQAREILRSEEGYALAIRRITEPESVFGQLKNNRGFRRFLLRGMEKVTLEVGRLSLAHNLLMQAANDKKRRAAILQ